MVYSTCTFAPEEDEAGISDFLKRHPEFSVVRLEPGGYPEGLSCGHPEWSQDQNPDLKYTFRIWPHEARCCGTNQVTFNLSNTFCSSFSYVLLRLNVTWFVP